MHLYINLLCIWFVVSMMITVKLLKRVISYKGALIYVFCSVGVLLYFLFHWFSHFKGVWNIHRQYAFGIFITFLVFSSLLSFFWIMECVITISSKGFKSSKETIASRRKFIRLTGLGIASIPFIGMIYGMIYGKYNYKVMKHTLYFDDLPSNFNGYQITHISDIHAGSFDNVEKVQYAVDLINKQKSDAILFTGDLVNNLADEMRPWQKILGQLHASDGVFSVLGNHDYGDYVSWDSIKAKEENFEKLKDIQNQMGFDLLLNTHRYVQRKEQRICFVGVENWGKGFIQKGNLNQALNGTKSNDFCILMSHDPTHWQYKVLKYKRKIPLTLSGHTHGMQFGIEIPHWFKWSPIQWKYKYWAGIYQIENQYLNVNRGLGYLGFPGRVGIYPEITVITLKKKDNSFTS